jgi:DNA-binding LacI/PurR family transcriptional regulator
MRTATGSREIAECLRSALVGGRLKPGQQIESESRLCLRFGACRVTVRKALTLLQGEGLLESRRGKGWYVVDTQRARRRTCMIGIVLADMATLDHQVPRAFIAGARDVLMNTPYHLQIMAINCSKPAMGDHPQVELLSRETGLVDHQRLDGLIVMAREVRESDVMRVAAHIPVAWADHASIPPRVVGVSHDCAGGAYDAARHLLSLGHRHIALVTVPMSVPQGRDQVTGVQLAYREAIRSGARVTVLCGESNRTEVGRRHGEQLLALPDRPTAVLCGSDDLALGVYDEIRRAGLRVPQDISMVGWNDMITTQQVPVPMTTVYTDHAARGRALAQAVLDLLQSRRLVSDTQAQIIPTRLIVRQSTAAPPAGRTGPGPASTLAKRRRPVAALSL